jgi:transcriptional regulator with GAF, ATPase, and Fis domain
MRTDGEYMRKETARWSAAVAAYEELLRGSGLRQAENVRLREEIGVKVNSGEIVGQSAAIHKVLFPVEQVAPTSATVLLLGETGTGKELLARALHAGSARHARPMVALNRAALFADSGR